MIKHEALPQQPLVNRMNRILFTQNKIAFDLIISLRKSVQTGLAKKDETSETTVLNLLSLVYNSQVIKYKSYMKI